MTVDLVLHIGCDKTGTTSIQQFLRRNRTALLRQQVLYPRTLGRVRHWDLGLYAWPDETLPHSRIWRREGHSSPQTFRRRVRRRLAREVARSGASSVVLSDETLFKIAPESMRRLHGLVADLAPRIRIVAYLRRQDDHLVSRYQQAVKVGEVLDLATWVTSRDFSRLYDYARRLDEWQRAFEPTELAVRVFERPRFVAGSLERDFLDAAGLDVATEGLRTANVRNESLGAEAVEMLRILNIHRIAHEGRSRAEVTNRPYVARLRDADGGPRLTLPAADLDRFMARWEASNRRVAIDRLGDRSGELFRSPRKTNGTTTVQRLDPARVEHYLELLEVPEADHTPIRRIAEREAGRRAWTEREDP